MSLGRLEGYAALWDAVSDRPAAIGDDRRFECVAPQAFRRALAAAAREPVPLCVNHVGDWTLARTGRGLELYQDRLGLAFRFDIPDGPLGEALYWAAVEGRVTGSSFKFNAAEVKADVGADGRRTLREVGELHDVSLIVEALYGESRREPIYRATGRTIRYVRTPWSLPPSRPSTPEARRFPATPSAPTPAPRFTPPPRPPASTPAPPLHGALPSVETCLRKAELLRYWRASNRVGASHAAAQKRQAMQLPHPVHRRAALVKAEGSLDLVEGNAEVLDDMIRTHNVAVHALGLPELAIA